MEIREVINGISRVTLRTDIAKPQNDRNFKDEVREYINKWVNA